MKMVWKALVSKCNEFSGILLDDVMRGDRKESC